MCISILHSFQITALDWGQNEIGLERWDVERPYHVRFEGKLPEKFDSAEPADVVVAVKEST